MLFGVFLILLLIQSSRLKMQALCNLAAGRCTKTSSGKKSYTKLAERAVFMNPGTFWLLCDLMQWFYACVNQCCYALCICQGFIFFFFMAINLFSGGNSKAYTVFGIFSQGKEMLNVWCGMSGWMMFQNAYHVPPFSSYQRAGGQNKFT